MQLDVRRVGINGLTQELGRGRRNVAGGSVMYLKGGSAIQFLTIEDVRDTFVRADF